MKALAELELIKRRNVDFAANIAENCDDMLTLINTMLDITRIEKKLNTSAKRELCLNELLEKLHEAFSTLTDDKSLDFEFSLPQEKINIFCHPPQVERMIANLIDNAIKYTPEKGKVAVLLAKNDKGDIVLTVSDTGCGISQNDLHNIFNRFYRADTSRSQPGNGLGLSMVKAVVDSMNGTITVTSPPGKGSTFALNFSSCKD